MKTNCFFIIIFATILGSCGQGTPSTGMGANADTTKIGNVSSYDTTKGKATSDSSMASTDSSKSGDAGFLKDVYSTGMFEIQAAQLANTNSKNAHVKQFATMMIQDHTSLDKDVSALAQKEGISLPSDLSGAKKDEYTKLQGLTGSDFDKEYADANVKGHTDAIQLFQNVINGNGPQDSKNLATNALPTLKKHLEHAQMLQKQLGNGRASSGNM